MIWSFVTVFTAIGSAFLLRGFVDGSRAGDPEGYLVLGSIILALAAVVALEMRIRQSISKVS